MTGILVGVLQIFAAVWVFKRVIRWMEHHDAQQQQKYLQDQIAHAKLVTDGYLKKIEKLHQSVAGDELSQLVLQDAINREMRAKASLRAVLEEQGCSEKQIEEVMDKIDGQ